MGDNPPPPPVDDVDFPPGYPGDPRLIRRTTVGLGRFDPDAR